MISQSLNGKWTLYYAETGKYTVDDYSKFDEYKIPSVPTNVPFGKIAFDITKRAILGGARNV